MSALFHPFLCAKFCLNFECNSFRDFSKNVFNRLNFSNFVIFIYIFFVLFFCR